MGTTNRNIIRNNNTNMNKMIMDTKKIFSENPKADFLNASNRPKSKFTKKKRKKK